MAPVRGSAPRRAKAMHKTASFAATNHPQHAATCCPNTSGQSASIELVAAPQVVVCRPHAVAAQPSRCRPERPHQCDRSAPPVQFSPRVSCRHKAYTTISLSPSLVFLAVSPPFPPLSFRPVWGGALPGWWSQSHSWSSANIGRSDPRPTVLAASDAAPVPVQRHYREQRTNSGTCWAYRAPVYRSCPASTARTRRTRHRRPPARSRAASPIHSSPRGRPAVGRPSGKSDVDK